MLCPVCACASPRRRPARSTSVERGRHCTTGSWRGATAPEFVLRIEDTDRERSTPENVEQIFEALRWLGLDWDGDPVFQSERRDRHAEVVEQLIAGGHAYRSTAGPRGGQGLQGGPRQRRLPRRGRGGGRRPAADARRGRDRRARRDPRRERLRAPPDGRPRDRPRRRHAGLPPGRGGRRPRRRHHARRARRRPLLQHAQADADPRGDGRRGARSTPTCRCCTGPDGKKLSKRHGAASVQELRDTGYLREAVRNYLALLGWGYDAETTYHTIEELQQRFSLERVSKRPAVFDEKKLRWMNGRYMRELPVEELTRRLETLHGPLRAWARRWRSRARSSRRCRSSGRWSASSSTGPADDPTLREKWLGAGGDAGRCWRRRARRWRRSRGRGPSRRSRRR